MKDTVPIFTIYFSRVVSQTSNHFVDGIRLPRSSHVSQELAGDTSKAGNLRTPLQKLYDPPNISL